MSLVAHVAFAVLLMMVSRAPTLLDMWAELSPDEQLQRGAAGTDQTVIDDRHFFIRGRIEDSISETVKRSHGSCGWK
jgi:hypothetical protein